MLMKMCTITDVYQCGFLIWLKTFGTSAISLEYYQKVFYLFENTLTNYSISPFADVFSHELVIAGSPLSFVGFCNLLSC